MKILFRLLCAVCFLHSALTPAFSSLETTSKAAILIDADSGRVLYEKNPDQLIPPASMSKMMTVYIIFDALKKGEIKLSDTYKISEKAWRQEGSRMFLKLNDQVTIENLLKGAIIHSGNDACTSLAEGFAGSVDGFVILMNKMAKKLGLQQSHFMNPTGLPHKDHYMSVRDLATLGRAIIRDFPEYYKIYNQKEFTWNKINQKNRNALLYSFKGADGIKTGHTNEAGYCLVGSAKRDNMRLISVVSGLSSNKQRRDESAKILGYGFSNYDVLNFPAGKKIKDIPVYLGNQETIAAILKEDLNILFKKGEKNKVAIKANYVVPLTAPIKKNDVIGRILITLPNQHATTRLLVAKSDMPSASWTKRLWVSLQYFLFGEPKFETHH